MFVKICGITNEEDALLAVALGADAVGFIFAPSERQIAPVRAGDIAKRLPAEVLTVGVFRNEAPSRVVELVHKAGLKAAQLHGHETPAETALVREQIPFVIKAVAAGTHAMTKAADFAVEAVLVDSPTPGSGRVFDWSLAEGAPRQLPRLLLAGGLNPDNVGDAIRKVRPWGVDVASGVEASPGRKDARLLRRFIREARRTGSTLENESRPVGGLAAFGPYDWEEDG